MSGEEKEVLNSIDSSNIFDEFETGELKNEIQSKVIKNKKNIYDYLSTAAGIISVIFWVNILVLGTVYLYIHQQNDIEKDKTAFLSPICGLFIGDVPNHNVNNECSSITFLDKKYKEKLAATKQALFNDKLSILEETYKDENFLKSKEVLFLQSTTQNKIRPLQLLDDFDELVLDFDRNNNGRILCSRFSISEESLLTASCEAFSASYESGIKGINGTSSAPASGTSISIAASFLNFIDKQSSDFILLDKQKVFTSQSIFDGFSQYTLKTNFELQLQYRNDNLINK